MKARLFIGRKLIEIVNTVSEVFGVVLCRSGLNDTAYEIINCFPERFGLFPAITLPHLQNQDNQRRSNYNPADDLTDVGQLLNSQ